MLVVTRYRVPVADAVSFRERANHALAILAGKPGCIHGQLGRSVDDPTLWVLTSEWVNVGSYRRALSSYEAKLGAVPLLSLAIDEPTAFEILSADGDRSGKANSTQRRSALAADAGSVGLGSAAAPVVSTDFDQTTGGGGGDQHVRWGEPAGGEPADAKHLRDEPPDGGRPR